MHYSSTMTYRDKQRVNEREKPQLQASQQQSSTRTSMIEETENATPSSTGNSETSNHEINANGDHGWDTLSYLGSATIQPERSKRGSIGDSYREPQERRHRDSHHSRGEDLVSQSNYNQPNEDDHEDVPAHTSNTAKDEHDHDHAIGSLRIKELKRWNEAFQEQIRELQKENNQLKRHHRNLDQDQEGLRVTNEQLRAIIEQKIADIEIRDKEIMKIRDFIGKMNDGWDIERHSSQTSIAGLQSKLHQLKEENLDYQEQLEKVTHIVSKLSKRGLPHPRDDGHFKTELNAIVDETRQFARSFTRGQKPLTLEVLSGIKMTESVQIYLFQGFSDLNALVSYPSGKFGNRVRTRCVEIIMLGELMARLLWGNHIGFPQKVYQDIRHNYTESMSCTKEERHLWKSLTVHLLTKDNKHFMGLQQKEIDHVTDRIHDNIAQWGEFKRVNKEGLRDIVSKVAQLGLELSQLPFRIAPLKVEPGKPFNHNYMRDAEPETDEDNDLDDPPRTTSIVLSPLWVKVTFNDDGEEIFHKNQPLCKAHVSCLA